MVNFTFLNFFRIKKDACWRMLLVAIFLMFGLSGFAQTNIGGVVNTYFEVIGITQPLAPACSTTTVHTITVGSTTGLAVGDKVLIIQMKGADINTANSNAGGAITAINNAGNYEFFEIKSISGNIITPKYPLIKNYTLTGLIQIVKIPKYTGTVNVTSVLTANEWSDATKTGGVLAIYADKLNFNANIDVAGKGFEGIQMLTNGTVDNCSDTPNSLFTLGSTDARSFTKGDGIVVDAAGSSRGRAPRANGGGAGIAGDSGGGGGSNYGAGGEGGKRWCDVDGANAGGIGGKPLSSFFSQDKVFLGGAGGTGYVTTGNPSSAADGGGIVIIFANEIIGNGYSIIANGFSPTQVIVSGSPDGGGGGGAGGTVVLKSPKFTGNLTVNVKGGDGQDLGTTIQHGPGGGGGGGALLYSLASLPANVTFSATGGIGGQHTNATRNGSQDGLVGGNVSLYIPVENPNYGGNIDSDTVSVECDLDDDNDGILDTVENGVLPDPFAFTGGSKIPNYFNPLVSGFLDTNADGIDDRYDADKDGILNQFDIDSDNDGCNDVIEAGFIDGDANGTLGSLPDTVETTATGNGMGTITNDGGYTGTNISVITYNASAFGGTVLAAQIICSGTSPVGLTLSGNTGSVVKWQKSSDLAFTAPIDIAGTATTLTGATIGNLTANTYFRAVVQSNACSSAFSVPVLITVNALPDASLVLGGTGSICSGTGTNITVGASVSGINYQLRNGTTNVGSAVAGTGGS
ncbi:hypothetical protein FNW52_07160, partial [Flavobacterium sp. ZT3R18]